MVDIGSSKTLSILVSNTGNMDLIFSEILSTKPEFTITPTYSTIVPAGTQMFDITFTPVEIGLAFAYINFKHNAPNGNDWFNISGIGGGRRIIS